MAVVSVGNDLQTPIEVKLRSGDWQVVYPQKSWDVDVSDVVATSVEIRLRENPALKGSCKVTDGSSVKGRDRAEARELTREGKRREEAQMRTEAMIQEAVTKWRSATFVKSLSIFIGLDLPILILSVVIPPGSALGAAVLEFLALVSGIPFIALGVVFSWPRLMDSAFGNYAVLFRFGFRLLGFLALALLLLQTVQHALQGLGFRGKLRERHPRTRAAVRGQLAWEYAGAWESLVSQGRNGEVSAAVVFLPEGTDDYGQCDSIPEAEGLPGTCWCTPLYGEQKPWGCRWFTKWRENIETAVQSGAELEVYYFQNRVGKGKVESFDTAGDDNLHREKVNQKQRDFEESPEFQQALDAGLGNLSKEPRGDGSSQYSREARRLFLASLSETEREYLATAEGLGNSQKAEVAWLEKKCYTYWEVDVCT
ncbi:unnamed protein product, partial [Symbiodinium necroappetens]